MGSRILRTLPDLMVLLSGLLTEAVGVYWLWKRLKLDERPDERLDELRAGRKRQAVRAAAWLFAAFQAVGFVLRYQRVFKLFPLGLARSWESAVLAWSLLTLPAVLTWGALLLGAQVFKRVWPRHEAGRRQFLQSAPALALAAPPALLGYGVYIARDGLRLREQRIVLPDLPADLDGLRIAQLTDIHLGVFLKRSQVERAVAMANETRPRITLVTGDLITTEEDPLDDCMQALKSLRAEAGVFGCMGNHEAYAKVEDYAETEGERIGLKFLRHQTQPLRFGSATLNLAGVDYQNMRRPYLRGAEDLVLPGAFNVLLSHNPDVFPVAAKKGFPLTLSGHTHGGQVRLEILSQDLNVARFFTPYVDGLYRRGPAAVFVSRGIGTIGVPARLGSPPEVALITLVRG